MAVSYSSYVARTGECDGYRRLVMFCVYYSKPSTVRKC